MRIQHNIAALNSHRNLTGNNAAVSKNLEKLSSGYRINRAGDDAAGLAISEKMRAQITGLQTAQKNAEDGVSLVQTAEGALTEVHSMLNRMVELATQSANGTYTEGNRAEMQKEIDALTEEIDRISATANFNGKKLFQGGGIGGSGGVPSIGGLELTTQEGTAGVSVSDVLAASDVTLADNDSFTLRVNYTDASGTESSIDLTLTYDKTNNALVGSDGTVLANPADAGKATAKELGDAFAKAIKNDTRLGSLFKAASDTNGKLTFTSKSKDANTIVTSLNTINNAGTKTDINITSQTFGTDAYESSDLSSLAAKDIFTIGGKKFTFVNSQDDAVSLGSEVNSIVLGTADTIAAADVTKMADLIQQKTGYKPEIDGTTKTQLNFKSNGSGSIGKAVTIDLHVGESSSDTNKISVKIRAMSSKSLGVSGVDIGTAGGAKAAIDTVNAAIDQVSSIRSDLGALQNRLEHTINNLGVQTENITAAESRIRDVDMAKEMMNYTKNNILVQASQAMLAQANQVPQGVLQLLQ